MLLQGCDDAVDLDVHLITKTGNIVVLLLVHTLGHAISLESKTQDHNTDEVDNTDDVDEGDNPDSLDTEITKDADEASGHHLAG